MSAGGGKTEREMGMYIAESLMDSIPFPSPCLTLSLQLQLINHFISGKMNELLGVKFSKSPK